jgi:hypothetical protein
MRHLNLVVTPRIAAVIALLAGGSGSQSPIGAPLG